MTQATGADGHNSSSLWARGLAAHWPVALVGLAVAVAWSDYLQWMAGQWWRSEYYSHGPLVPLVSGYLLYCRRAELAALPRRSSPGGLLWVAGWLAVYLAGVRLDVNFVQGFALVGALWGLVWWLAGWPLARATAFAAGYLLFMVPLERILVDLFAGPLQLGSAAAAGYAARAIGMDVLIEGTRLVVAGYTFDVAIPCSGLKTVISLGALGALMAYLFDCALWRRLVVLAVSVPVALAANAARIWVTLVLGGSIGPAAAEGFFHSASGILVFVLAVLGLLGAGRLVGCQRMRDDIFSPR